MPTTHHPKKEDTPRRGDEANPSQANGIGHPLFPAERTLSTSYAGPSAASGSGYDADNDSSADEDNTEVEESLKSAEPDDDHSSADTISTDQVTSDGHQQLSQEEHNICAGAAQCTMSDHSLSPDAGSEIDISVLLLEFCELHEGKTNPNGSE
jgi:hypothetical protein